MDKGRRKTAEGKKRESVFPWKKEAMRRGEKDVSTGLILLWEETVVSV